MAEVEHILPAPALCTPGGYHPRFHWLHRSWRRGVPRSTTGTLPVEVTIRWWGLAFSESRLWERSIGGLGRTGRSEVLPSGARRLSLPL